MELDETKQRDRVDLLIERVLVPITVGVTIILMLSLILMS